MRYPVPALWRIRPIEAHDGDTLRAIVDRGIDETAEWAIRLDGVWAPELGQPGGPETRAYVADWLAEHGDASEWPLLLQTLRTPRSAATSASSARRPPPPRPPRLSASGSP